jgi:hypothetical protein
VIRLPLGQNTVTRLRFHLVDAAHAQRVAAYLEAEGLGPVVVEGGAVVIDSSQPTSYWREVFEREGLRWWPEITSL